MKECSICGEEITEAQMDDRHWLHDEGCHEECCPCMSQEYEDSLIKRAFELTIQKRGGVSV